MVKRMIARLQTPADNTGSRTDIHLITHADAVIVDDMNTLSDKLKQYEEGGIGGGTKFELSEQKPTSSCVWAQILKTDPSTEEELV